jgi:hypothetical protein
MDEHQRGPVQLSKLKEVKKRIENYGLKIGVAWLPRGDILFSRGIYFDGHRN